MSDDYVSIPLTDVTAKVGEVDHLRAALEKTPPKADRPVTAVSSRGASANRLIVSLPPGLELTETLKGMVLAAVTDYVSLHKDQILAMLLGGVKVEK